MIKSTWHIGDATQCWLSFWLLFWQGGLKAIIFSPYLIFGTQGYPTDRGQKHIRVFKPHFGCWEIINLYAASFFPLRFALCLMSVELLTKEPSPHQISKMQVASITVMVLGDPEAPQLQLSKGMLTFCIHFSQALNPGCSRFLSLVLVESITVLGH